MEFDKLRYYLAGIGFIVISLVCMLSLYQQFASDSYYPSESGYNNKIIFFDLIAIAITLPAGILCIRKARRLNK